MTHVRVRHAKQFFLVSIGKEFQSFHLLPVRTSDWRRSTHFLLPCQSVPEELVHLLLASSSFQEPLRHALKEAAWIFINGEIHQDKRS